MAPKNFEIQHPSIETKNLFVIKAMQSLTSRGLVKTQYSWQYYYYTMTPEGLDYLREWLHLPAEIVPATHIKQQRSHAPPRGMMGEEARGERRFGGRGRGEGRGEGRGGDREGGYRRRDAGEGKEGGAPGDFAPQLYVEDLLIHICEDMLTRAQQPWWIRPWPWRCPSLLSDGRTVDDERDWKRTEMTSLTPVLGRFSDWHIIA